MLGQDVGIVILSSLLHDGRSLSTLPYRRLLRISTTSYSSAMALAVVELRNLLLHDMDVNRLLKPFYQLHCVAWQCY